MLIKIAQDNGWIIYDGFEKVHYEHLEVDATKKLDVDATWFGSKKQSSHCVFIVARRKTVTQDKMGLEFSILADDVVYLCNDEGKTIERIN